MKFAKEKVIITPQKPVLQGGYGSRNHPYEAVHDDLYASIFILEINEEVYVWVGCDLSNGTSALIDEIFKYLRYYNEETLEKDHMILGGSHTHSGPNIYVDKEPEQADYECFTYIASVIAKGIIKAMHNDRVEVKTEYADVLIDGLYSNRNSITKECDKHVHLIKFVSKDKIEAIFVSLSHHCTILGPQNYMLTADLFGAIRDKIEKHFVTTVLMAQGTAGDMSNHMYRTEATFNALEKQAEGITKQIFEKMDFIPVNMESIKYYRKSHMEGYILNRKYYEDQLAEYKNRFEKANGDDEKWLFSKIRNAEKKIALGDGPRAIEMVVEVFDYEDVRIIVVPGELGSILGNKIKKASKKKPCIIWGYSNGANLGYLVEKAAYEEESFESCISAYPSGVADHYTEFILKTISEIDNI